MIGPFLALAISFSACGAPEGASAVIDDGRRFVVVGELHGTAEVPKAFSGLVCEAAARGPVTVGLELPLSMKAQLDAFLNADSHERALAGLRGTALMDPRMSDGRTSVSMLEMLESFRHLKNAGHDIAIMPFQPNSGMHELPQSFYELEMGYLLSRAAVERPQARVFVLVGNIHARKTAIANIPEIGLPAAAHLPADETLSLYVVQQGGAAWNCAPTCGANPVPSRYEADARGIIIRDYGEGAFDGVIALGPTSASPPVAEASE
jgi:hypothetical protein